MKEVIIKLGSTELPKNGGRVNHIAALVWEDGSPAFDLETGEGHFERIINPGAPENQRRSTHNRSITPEQMQSRQAQPFSKIIDDFMHFVEGTDRFIVFNNGFVTPMFRREIEYLNAEDKERCSLDLYKFVHLQSVLQSNVNRSHVELSNQQMETFAQHFGVNHGQKPIKRCNADLDVLTLSKLYEQVRESEAAKINELLGKQAAKKRKAEAERTTAAQLVAEPNERVASERANNNSSSSSSSSNTERTIHSVLPTGAAEMLSRDGVFAIEPTQGRKAKRKRAEISSNSATEKSAHKYALRSCGPI